MKKIVSLGIASAVLALTAVAVSADAVSGTYLAAEFDGTATAGGTIKVNVKLTQDGITDTAFIVKTEGLELVGEPTGAGSFIFNANTGMATFASATELNKDTVVATFEYKITAAEGEDVSFTLSDHAEYAGATNTDPVTTTVGAAADESDSSDVVDSNDESSDVSGTDTENPGTGIALAVVPAVIAGAAVVVAAKKRK